MKQNILSQIISVFCKKSVEAELIAKNMEVSYGSTVYLSSRNVRGGVNKKEMLYIVSFVTEEGKTKTFLVSRSCYEKLQLNEKGLLVYRRKKFISFRGVKRNRASHSKGRGMEFIGMKQKM